VFVSWCFTHGAEYTGLFENFRGKIMFFFILVVSCIVNLFYVSNQRDAVLSSLFIVLQNHSTCFGCPLHPSSGVHKTVVTTTGTSHVYRSGSYLTLAWPNLTMQKWGSCPTYGFILTDFTSVSPIYSDTSANEWPC